MTDTKQQKHTELPWRVADYDPRTRSVEIITDSADVTLIAELNQTERKEWHKPESAEADARYIVLSANYHERLKDALVHLRNEVRGSVGIAAPEIRAAIGNTNFACIENRLAEAESLLAEIEGEK